MKLSIGDVADLVIVRPVEIYVLLTAWKVVEERISGIGELSSSEPPRWTTVVERAFREPRKGRLSELGPESLRKKIL